MRILDTLRRPAVARLILSGSIVALIVAVLVVSR